MSRLYPALSRFSNDQKGFTLAEQLVSVLCISLLVMVTTAGLGTAIRAHDVIKTRNDMCLLMEESVNKISDELANSLAVEATAEDTQKNKYNKRIYQSASTRCAQMIVGDNRGIRLQKVTFDAQGSAVIKDDVYLVDDEGNKAHVFFVEEPTYHDETNTWAFTLKVTAEGASSEMLLTVTVRRATVGGYYDNA